MHRCFIVTNGQPAKEREAVRQCLRVIAGAHVLSTDPDVLNHGQVEAAISACPPDAQYERMLVGDHDCCAETGFETSRQPAPLRFLV